MMKFTEYTKKSLTAARPLTEADFTERSGIIETLEGSAHFIAGDYLCVGVKGEEWPVAKAKFEAMYTRVGSAEVNGFFLWRKKLVVQAAAIPQGFQVRIRKANGTTYEGEGGVDVLVYTGDDVYICKRDIFEATYVNAGLEAALEEVAALQS